MSSFTGQGDGVRVRPDTSHVVFPGRRARGSVQSSPERPARRVSTLGAFAAREEERCLQRVLDSAGLNPTQYKSETLYRRLPAMLRALRAGDPMRANESLDRQPRLVNPALNALIIGVTSFFRDEPVFEALKSRLSATFVRPGLPARGPRVWSAGCSCGAELYSVAMLLAELGLLDSAELLGTDCRPDAVARAAIGQFSEDEIRGVGDDRLGRFFRRGSGNWQVDDSIRGRTRWRKANILTLLEPGTWDVILCRNLAIYLSPSSASELWIRLESCLRPGGLLVLGKAERPVGVRNLVAVAPCIYRRPGESNAGEPHAE